MSDAANAILQSISPTSRCRLRRQKTNPAPTVRTDSNNTATDNAAKNNATNNHHKGDNSKLLDSRARAHSETNV